MTVAAASIAKVAAKAKFTDDPRTWTRRTAPRSAEERKDLTIENEKKGVTIPLQFFLVKVVFFD